ncbi:MAG TPA: hypothetical protein VLX59_10450 [Acidimicrobiales bacterium]|nr:hypothetical protein [Acidimicrobiales bacterium]
MADQPVVLAVASYPSRGAAHRDFDALWSLEPFNEGDQVSAALVEKGSSGELEMNSQRSSAHGVAWGIALLGGALTTVAAPMGVSYLGAGLSSIAEWAGAAAIVGRFWYEIPRDMLRSMSNLLEAGQAGLVVVAIAHDSEHLMACLSGATSTVVSESIPLDLAADFTRAAGQG